MSKPTNCQDCGIDYPYLQRAHSIARHKGGSDDPNNIIWICPNCHHLRDRADRVEWLKQRWAEVPPEQRREEAARRMKAMTPEQREARARKISKSKMGVPKSAEHRAKIAASKTGVPQTSENVAKRAKANRGAWARKTPEEREAWRERCRQIKRAKV